MDKVSLREIFYKYAEERGGGLPLTAQEMCNAVVLWVQEYVKQHQVGANFDNLFGELPITIERNESENTATIKLDVVGLLDLFEGSETIVVDLNETNDKIEIHLDSETVAKLDRAILTPLQRPTELVLPMVTPTGAVVYEPARSFSNEFHYYTITGSLYERGINVGIFNLLFTSNRNFDGVPPFMASITPYYNYPAVGYCQRYGDTGTDEFMSIYGVTKNSGGEMVIEALSGSIGSLSFIIPIENFTELNFINRTT